MSAVRDTLRSKILAQKAGSQIVTLDDGTEVEVRQATVGSLLDAVQQTDIKRRMANMLISCCFVPGTGEPLFEEADFDTLMGMPSGGYYQKLMDVVNAGNMPEQEKAAKKSSE